MNPYDTKTILHPFKGGYIKIYDGVYEDEFMRIELKEKILNSNEKRTFYVLFNFYEKAYVYFKENDSNEHCTKNVNIATKYNSYEEAKEARFELSSSVSKCTGVLTLEQNNKVFEHNFLQFEGGGEK